MDNIAEMTEDSRVDLEQHAHSQETKKQLAVYIRNAYKDYGTKKKPMVVLEGLNMTVPKGYIYGLLGASGCGKTTLLSCIVGRRRLNSGKIWVLGSTDCNIPSYKLGYMPQEIALYGEFTIGETLMFFGWIAGMPMSKIEERTHVLVNLLNLPYAERRVKSLSGGQQRRVSLAAALLHEPELLILDEPTVGLDPVLRENIWNHFSNITKECGTTVIITTHYIDETRQANLIALMRGGHFLAEDSPTNLLHRFGMDSLENVFLKLSIMQNNARRYSLTAVDGGAICEMPIESKDLDGVTNEAFIMDEVNPDTVKVGKVAKSMSISSSQANFEIKSKRNYSPVNNNHLKALLWKNFSWMLRNLPIMASVLIMPILQGTIFCLGIGHDPINLPVAVINYENNNNRICQDSLNCNSTDLGCHYLKYLEKRNLNLMYYESEEAARDAVLKANVHASITIKENYTLALKARLDEWNEAEDWDIQSSEVDVFGDVANKFIYQYIRMVLYGAFKSFVEDYMVDCGMETRWLTASVKMEEPIYGASFPDFRDFVAPGIILTFTSFLGMGLTSLAMLLERKEGILERLLVSGTNEVEMLFSHAICQFVVMVMQSAITLVCLFVIFGITIHGSFLLVVLMTLSAGLFGMCSGLLISSVCDSEVPASYAAMGSYFPMMMLGGIIWPVEGMHYLLQKVVALLPFTYPTESLRSIMQRGWGVTEASVYKGFLIFGGWILILLMLSILVIRYKRN